MAIAETMVRIARQNREALNSAPPGMRATVLDRLLDYDGTHERRRALAGELVMVNDLLDAVADGRIVIGLDCTTDSTGFDTIGLPLLRGDQAQLTRWLTEQNAAADAPSLPAFLKRATTAEQAFEENSYADPLATAITGSMLWSFDDQAGSEYRTRVALRCAAISLAIAAYRLDHADALPPTLDALVPEYLPAVPRDALAADAPLRYDPERHILWSVGPNGVDDGGSIDPLRQTSGRIDDWERFDYVVPLTKEAHDRLFPPPVEEDPTTQPYDE